MRRVSVTALLSMFLAMILAMIAPTALGAGAYDVLPGRDLLEQEIHWAWRRLPELILACTHSRDCGLDGEQKALARRIAANRKSYSDRSLIFRSEAEFGAFTSARAETHRLALTGDTPRSPIVINRDLLSDGGRSRGIAFWFGILAHEMVHHLGVPDDENRVPDRFGSAMARAGEALLVMVGVPEESEDVRIGVLNMPVPETSSVLDDFPSGLRFHVFKSDAMGVVDDVSVASAFRVTPICVGKGQGVAYRVAPEAVVVNDDPRGGKRAHLSLNADVACWDSKTRRSFGDSVLFRHSFSLRRDSSDRSWVFDRDRDVNWGEGLPSDGFGAFERATILEWRAPESVRAGESLRIWARIQARADLRVIGCSAYINSPAWPAGPNPLSAVIVPDACRFKMASQGVWEIELSRKIPEGTREMALRIANLCLTIPDTRADCIPAYPARQNRVQVVPARSLPSAAVEAFELRDLVPLATERGATYAADRGFLVRFRVANSSGLESAVLTIDADGTDDEGLTLSVPIHNGPNAAVRRLETEVVGTSLMVRAWLVLPERVGSVRIVRGRITGVNLVTRELQGVSLELDGASPIVHRPRTEIVR